MAEADDTPRAGLTAVDQREESRAWEQATTLDQRPEAYRMALLVLGAIPVFVAIIGALQPWLLGSVLGPMVVAELVVATHLLLLWWSSTPRQILLAHLWIQLGMAMSIAALATRLPYLDFFTAALLLCLLAPLAGFTWPRWMSAAASLSVPLIFVLAHLLQAHEHALPALARSTLLLCVGAALSTILMARKHEVQREAFRSRRALDRAHRELAASMQRLVRTQGELVRSEKLAVLGQLVAGVAHELNTPLGAISACAETQARSLPGSLRELPGMLGALDEAQAVAFQVLLQRALQASEGRAARSTREERRERRRLAGEFEAMGVAEAQACATILVELGLCSDLEAIEPLLRHPGAVEVIEQVDALVSVLRSASTIKLAAGRASRIVLALKRYAHPGDLSGLPVRASLAEDLETVLTLYVGHLRPGVRVVRDYADQGEVEARHEALNQVWTNLVANALQAMDGTGTLTVRVAAAGEGWVRVEVEDDGPGIPEEVLQHIFEPFFTTKAAGEGSGLGLSICQDIVQAHGGSMSVESERGRTVFAVRLPVSAGVDPGQGPAAAGAL